MLNRIREKVNQFLESDKEVPVLAAITSGLYPLLYCYDKNFSLLNSWEQLVFYIGLYLVFPVLVFLSSSYIIKKLKLFSRYKKYLIPVLNFTFFAMFIALSTHGVNKKKITLLILCIAFILGILLFKHLKKLIVLQLLLTIIIVPKFILNTYKYFSHSNDWIQQPDSIEQVVFKKKPNIYFIQPDGYANFEQIKQGYYNFDNSKFEAYLDSKKFKNYKNYRSNYISTLSSNSALFGMKHHYYNDPKKNSPEMYGSRSIIAGNNPVISILKRNGYKTNLILEEDYFLVNRPKLIFDYCNFDYSEISYLARGFDSQKDTAQDLEKAIDNNTAFNNFYFIYKWKPGHIATRLSDASGKETERQKYLEKVSEANSYLQQIIEIIESKDKNALIIIAADHGGFVGLDYSFESRVKLSDDVAVKSIFTSILAIKWPQESPTFDSKFKSPVNFFRILFSYLSEDARYLNNLQEDKSYSVIEKGAPFGVYELINEKGTVVFEKH